MLMRRPLCLALLATLAAAGCSSTTREPREADTTPATRGAVVDAKTEAAAPKDRDEEKRDVVEATVAHKAMAPPPPKMPAPQNGRKQDGLETIVVAGSRINRVDVETASPVVMLESPPRPSLAQSPPAGPMEPGNRENYAKHADNPVTRTAETPVSTFSIDVDTGSYTNVRHMLTEGRLPPADSVRAEEFINYFDYGYTPPQNRDIPFAVTTELAPAPWNEKRTLLLVGIQGFRVEQKDIPPANLVFLIDTSGSMESADKIELLKASFKEMVPRLRAQDRVSIVVYAGSAGLVLPPTPGDQHEVITAALDKLQAGGSTNGGAGIELAYATAQKAFIQHGVNRVILATDGDFNVGTVNTEALKTLIADKRKSGVALTTLGFGEGNYNDEMAEQLADIGNGNHYYVDTLKEGRRVLQDSMSATLMTIAKDVKIQIEFNPSVVEEYRLVGYEDRVLRREDFNNDKIDAGEIGAGHNVTALYELTLKGSGSAQVDPLRYGTADKTDAKADELAFLRLRYKQPEQDVSRLIERPIARHEVAAVPSERLRFAAAVGAFADSLRGATHLGQFDLARIAALADDARGKDGAGYRAEFVGLVRKAQSLQTPEHAVAANIAR